MPFCVVYTNMKRSDLEEMLFEKRVAECIAEVAQIPSEYVYVTIFPESPTFWAGSRGPAMLCQIHKMVTFENKDNRQRYYSKLFEKLKATTKLPGNRIIVQLCDIPGDYARVGN